MYDRHPTPRCYLIPARRDQQTQSVSTSFIKKRFASIAARATPPVVGSHVHVHTTRHTVAVALRMAGRRLVDIQAFLGHRNIATTANVYSLPMAYDLALLLRFRILALAVPRMRNAADLPWISHANEKTNRNGLLESLTDDPQ